MGDKVISRSASASGSFSTKPTEKDPYVYQVGFGNKFATEAIPNTLPQGRNFPQKVKYGLYCELLTGSAFAAPRNQNQSALMYRIRPSVAHDGFSMGPELPDLEHNFLSSNPKVTPAAAQIEWGPVRMPSVPTDFIQGIKTLAGAGDPILREGTAMHVYAANTSMEKKAFMNRDGDLLIVPSLGRLDIQTELGKLMVKAGEIAVIQQGIRFKVSLPDGPSHGYLQELFGAHFELPELGPIGSSGLANVRDFATPVACFDMDQTPWEIINKVNGKLHILKQRHTPFDVVAWHGNYAPYKYDLRKFVAIGAISHDHIDPSAFCVLTAKSKHSGTPLTDFLAFPPRWDVAEQTFRPAYYHRNVASEFLGTVYGSNPAPYDEFPPGSIWYITPLSPHGQTTDVFNYVSDMPLVPMRISEDALLIMFESSMHFSVTEFGSRTVKEKRRLTDTELFEGLRPNFIDQLDEVNKDLRDLGLSELK